MYHDFLGPRGLQGTHMDTLKPKNSKLITFTVRGCFFTFWAILAHSAAFDFDPIKELALLWSSSLSTLRSTYSSITSIKVNLESWSSEYTIFYTPCIPDTYLFSSQYYYLKWISMPYTKFLAFLGRWILLVHLFLWSFDTKWFEK